MKTEELLARRAAAVEEELKALVSGNDPDYGLIHDAMRYSLLGGGKRLRPFLTLEFARLAARCAGEDEDEAEKRAMPFACALEMIHTYSLIHDDLPCMDDDDLRRGRPTSHKVFGEANAVLAGDALLTEAFGAAVRNEAVSPLTRCQAVGLLSSCAGADGMVGGQVLDLKGENERFGLPMLGKLQSLKTGQLIRCAALLGCLCGRSDGAVPDRLRTAAETYAMGVGRAFQVTDDILDAVGDEASLGKPIGSDEKSGKSTFVAIKGLEEAEKAAIEYTNRALGALDGFDDTDFLRELTEMLLHRHK